MSTRSTTTIKYGPVIVPLYRHMDGYPAEAGATLAQAIMDHKTPQAILTDLLGEQYEATEYRSERTVYELTPYEHGDLEWTYEVSFDADDVHSFEIRIGQRSDDFETWTYTTMNLKAFVEQVNKERESMNSRIATLREEQPKLYGDCEDYPMLEASFA